MAELVGGAILSAVIKTIIATLTSPEVLNFFRNNKPISEVLRKLQIILCSANALLNDAEAKQVTDVNVQCWVEMLNEVLSDADDVIDDINTEAIRHKIEGDGILKNIVPASFNAFNRDVRKRMEKIIASVDLLLDQKDRLGLKEGVQSKRLERSPAPLVGDPSDVYGRGDDKEAIVKMLFSENVDGGDKVSVIPIVGMGGVGKTTLARLVYEDSRVKNHFEHRVWVTVSDSFDVFRLAKQFLEGLGGKECDAKDLGKLSEELEKFLGGKKFLLVLDDVWNENYILWNSLKSYLQVGSDGCKILVTTRNEEIGSKMGSVCSHPLKPMEDDDCWQLFEKHAFRSVEANAHDEVEKIGKEIVKKCKGLPLAIMSLAGLLSSVSDPKEWEKILKSDVWELHNKGQDEILPSLWLSYSYLPSHLKRCFAYCSIFPKDFEYEKEKIIRLWMAEGLLQGESMEDEGEEYFKTLISRSLFQRSTKDKSNVIMHDLVHDLASFVSGKSFCLRLGKDDDLERFTIKTRHLLFDSELDGLERLSKANSLRSLERLSSESIYIMSGVFRVVPKKFGSLRVLNLSVCRIVGKVHHSIGKLKHLRYLDLSNNYFERLPATICALYNLQTLLLRNCWALTRLPAKMDRLTKLRHLDISETRRLKEVPPQIYKMKSLQVVTKFVLGRGSRINELIKFPQCLDISGLENIVDVNDALEAGFEEKSHVTELILSWNSRSNDSVKDREIVDAMKPHPNLKKLDIRGYRGKELSHWITDPSFTNITDVSLSNCENCCQLPPFGQLPSLKKLIISRLHSIKVIGSEFYGSSSTTPFISLEFLKIEFMNELESLSFEVGAFPNLKELELFVCEMLKSMSYHCLPSLENLQIYSCPELESSGLPLPPSLQKLNLHNCKMLVAQHMHLPTTLVSLTIASICNLKSLNGKGFQNLTSLKWLEIWDCPKLESLPEEGIPTSIQRIHVCNCEVLAPRLKRETGKDWHKISHIPKIYIDYKEN